MKPAPFKYYAPTTVDGALAHLAEHGYDAKPLAGGQSLIPTMNFRLSQPAVLVDLNNIPALSYIRPDDGGGVRVGAMTRHSQVEHDPLVAERASLVHEAMPHIAHQEIRNRGTFGGSISHADPASELAAVSVALRARFRLRGQSGERWVPADEFFLGPFFTVLDVGELLVEIALPPMPPRGGWAFQELCRRHNDFALVGVAALVTLDQAGACQEARLVFLSVGDGPVEAGQAAQVLQGQAPTPEAIQAAAETAATEDVDPVGDIHATADYRRHLVKVLSRRALTQAFERAIPGT
jgi:carbon-monoxide dehydrogenase medium subunit